MKRTKFFVCPDCGNLIAATGEAPRCIIPFGVEAVVDAEKQIIRFTN